jgi:hypothetical protein
MPVNRGLTCTRQDASVRAAASSAWCGTPMSPPAWPAQRGVDMRGFDNGCFSNGTARRG